MEQLGAGAISGLATCLTLQPLDLLRTRLQEQQKGLSIPKIIAQIYKTDGMLGFWRGTAPSVWRTVPGAAFYFALVHQLRYLLLVASLRGLPVGGLIDGSNHKVTNYGNLLIGASARSTAGFLLMPTTVIKTRFESQAYKSQYKSILDAVRGIYRENGLKGLWSGWGSTLLRDAPYAGLYLLAYERLKPLYGGEDFKGRALSGLTAGSLATMATHPFDLLRTRIQLNRGIYPDALRAARRVIQDEGMVGLYRGLLPRMLRKSLSSAIGWVVFEELTSKKKKNTVDR